MVNILGGENGALSENLYGGYPHVFARDPRLKVHLYGKDVLPGRKGRSRHGLRRRPGRRTGQGAARRGLVPRRPGMESE